MFIIKNQNTAYNKTLNNVSTGNYIEKMQSDSLFKGKHRIGTHWKSNNSAVTQEKALSCIPEKQVCITTISSANLGGERHFLR